MNDNAAEIASPEADNIAERILSLREIFFRQWREGVRAAVPEARNLSDKILTNALRGFFDELASALKMGRPYFVVSPGIGASFFHGRERANLTGYGATELLQELQLFRQTLFEVAEHNNISLSSKHRSIIGRSIDNATCDAISAFAIVQKEVGETFIKSLSHDLRNPLHVASASMQLIQLKSHEENVLVLAERAYHKLSDIDKMIETLLDAASLKDRRKFRLLIQKFNITSLAQETCSEMSSTRNPIVCVGSDIEGYWCSSSLRRVLENLLSNAVKYGKPGAKISVRVTCAEKTVNLAVHNEGAPIPDEQRHLLFSTFHRLEDVTLTGWGLGLPFVQLVSESHGGFVNVESTAKDGTTFSITMPLDCRPYSTD